MSKPLSDYRTDYEVASAKASEINRTLALAGVAIIWTFTKNNEKLDKIEVSTTLKWALFYIIISLGLDLFQYIWRTIAIAIFYRVQEKRIDRLSYYRRKKAMEDINNFPSWVKICTWIIFSLKILSMIMGYYFILKFLLYKI